MDSSDKRFTEAKERIHARLRALREQVAKQQPQTASMMETDPCATEQAFYDALVNDAAQKSLIWDDKKAEADQAWSDYDTAMMMAMAAYMVLAECRMNTPEA